MRHFLQAAVTGLVLVWLMASVNAGGVPRVTTGTMKTDSHETTAHEGKRSIIDPTSGLEWIPFPNAKKFSVLGLPWFDARNPVLLRVPGGQIDAMPNGVKRRSTSPSGARILLRCNTTRLALQLTTSTPSTRRHFDVFVDETLLNSGTFKTSGPKTVLFEALDRKQKEIVIYLPHDQQAMVEAVGVDSDTVFAPPVHMFAKNRPVVFYGSSVCQGSAASRPAMTYPAIVCREMNLDFVNLGFGGAGKAEARVVDLVTSLPACCYVFDLGKSYGMQDFSAYREMLETTRKRRPNVPIVCITPITSAREVSDESYARKSEHTRTAVRQALSELSFKENVYLVEGADLLGFNDHGVLSKDGVHPSDQGYNLISERLKPTLARILR